jgi:hypothetical protein
MQSPVIYFTENAKAKNNFTTKLLQNDVSMNTIGVTSIINKYLNYFFEIGNTSICKAYVVKFVVSLASLLHYIYFFLERI